MGYEIICLVTSRWNLHSDRWRDLPGTWRRWTLALVRSWRRRHAWQRGRREQRRQWSLAARRDLYNVHKDLSINFLMCLLFGSITWATPSGFLTQSQIIQSFKISLSHWITLSWVNNDFMLTVSIPYPILEQWKMKKHVFLSNWMMHKKFFPLVPYFLLLHLPSLSDPK